MSLFDGLPLEAHDPPQPDTTPAAIPYLATITRASNGDQILLCNVTPPPAGALAEAKARNLPIFTTAEIPAMRQAAAADPATLDNLIHSRRLFGWKGPVIFQGAA